MRFHYSLLSAWVYVLIFYNKKVKKGGKESEKQELETYRPVEGILLCSRAENQGTSWRETQGLGGFSIAQLVSPTDREELMVPKKRGTCWSTFLE